METTLGAMYHREPSSSAMSVAAALDLAPEPDRLRDRRFFRDDSEGVFSSSEGDRSRKEGSDDSAGTPPSSSMPDGLLRIACSFVTGACFWSI